MMSARMVLAERWMPTTQCASTSSSSSSERRRAMGRVVEANNAEFARTRTRRRRRPPPPREEDQCFANTVDEERRMAASVVQPSSSKAKGDEERNKGTKGEEDEEMAETKRRERRRRRRRQKKKSSGARRNEGRASLANAKSGGTKKEGNGKDATMEKDSPDSVVTLDAAELKKSWGEAVKELLRLEYIANALDNDELFAGTRGEGMDASDEKNPMATSDAILSIFDAKPKNATEMISDSGVKIEVDGGRCRVRTKIRSSRGIKRERTSHKIRRWKTRETNISH